jgi:hypothetical protein
MPVLSSPRLQWLCAGHAAGTGAVPDATAHLVVGLLCCASIKALWIAGAGHRLAE